MSSFEIPRAPVRPGAPTSPVPGADYLHVLRNGRSRWWNTPLAWLVAVVALVGVLLVAGAAFQFGAVLDPDARGGQPSEAVSSLILDVALAGLVLVALAGVGVGFPVRGRHLHSVEGWVRWRWLGRSVAVTLPIWAVVIWGELAVGMVWGDDGFALAPDWPLLLAGTLLLTPLQAAGEEYLFRGFLLTTLGGLFRDSRVGLVVASLVSAVLFAAAHGSTDPWIVAELAVMALTCCYLTWRTGGLESAVALHLVNNVVVSLGGIVTDSVADGYVTESSEGHPATFVVSLVMTLLAAVLLTRGFARSGRSRVVTAGAPVPLTPPVTRA